MQCDIRQRLMRRLRRMVSDDLTPVPPNNPKISWGSFSRSPNMLGSFEMERMK
jgi:hypothetical protein